MLLGARQFFERRGAPTPPLPYDAEVEYLESTGKQHIDTLIVPSDNMRVLTSLVWTKWVLNAYITPIGEWTGTNKTNCYLITKKASANYIGMRFNETWINTSVTPALNQKYLIESQLKSGDIYMDIDGATVITHSGTITNDSARSLYLFALSARDIQGPAQWFSGRIYTLKLWKDDILVRDFIPVRITNEQGQPEGAMYDRVSGALFRNAGTGAFLYGNDK